MKNCTMNLSENMSIFVLVYCRFARIVIETQQIGFVFILL